MESFKAQQKLKQLKYIQDLQKFNSNLQKGDLGVSHIIDNGFILYGQTRTGKTATGHILCGNPLKGNKISGQQMVQTTTSRHRKAKIGNNMNSQTLVPNFFQVKLKNINLPGSTYVVDTPGYGDTYGVLRILANGYYHYRLYSKVKNMKFILCFDAIHLKNTGQSFIDTIIQFTSSFKDYLDVKEQIWQSSAFLFTKVDQKQYSLDDLILKLQAFIANIKTQLDQKVQQAVKQFIRYIIDQKKIFLIKKIKKGQSASAGDLLQKIDNSIKKWWKRDYDTDKKCIDMSRVLFSISRQIIISTTQSDKSRQQFTELIQYYNIKIKEFVQQALEGTGDLKDRCSLSYVLHQLVKDAMGSPDSHNFLNVMAKYIEIYYNKFDIAYKQQRQKKQKQLFHLDIEPSDNEKTSMKFRAKDRNYLVKKFNTLRKIEQLKEYISTDVPQQRTLKCLEACQKNLFQIIRQLNRVSYKRTKSFQIIYKYGYLIHRIVQEAKVFLLLIQLTGTQQNARRIQQTANGQFIDLITCLKGFMNIPFKYNNKEYQCDELHLQFVKKFSFTDPNYKDIVINESLIEFFTQIDIEDPQDSQKLVKLILKYSDQIIKQSQDRLSIGSKQTYKLIQRLTNARVNCQAAYHLNINNPHQKNSNMLLIRKTTKNLAKLLELLGKYQLSRKVYETIKFVDSVCKLYELEINALTKMKEGGDENRQKQFDLRIEYSEYLANHLRDYKAIQVLQQTFQLAEDIDQVSKVKQKFNDLRLQMRERQFVTQYETNLFNDEYFQQFNEELQEQIMQLTKNVLE